MQCCCVNWGLLSSSVQAKPDTAPDRLARTRPSVQTHTNASQPARPFLFSSLASFSHTFASHDTQAERFCAATARSLLCILIKALLVRRRRLVARGLASLPPTAPYSLHRARPWFSFLQGGTSCAIRTTHAPRTGRMWATSGGCQVAGLPPCWSMAAKETGSVSTKASKSLSTPPFKGLSAYYCACLCSPGKERGQTRGAFARRALTPLHFLSRWRLIPVTCLSVHRRRSLHLLLSRFGKSAWAQSFMRRPQSVAARL